MVNVPPADAPLAANWTFTPATGLSCTDPTCSPAHATPLSRTAPLSATTPFTLPDTLPSLPPPTLSSYPVQSEGAPRVIWLAFRYAPPPSDAPSNAHSDGRSDVDSCSGDGCGGSGGAAGGEAEAERGDGNASTAPRLVIFNRVPKCGSTTLEGIIRRQASMRGFSFVRSDDYVNNTLTLSEQRDFAMHMSALGRQRLTLYDRHVLHVDLRRFEGQLGLAPRPIYINLVRDPIRMQISAFYFWQSCVCTTRQAFCEAGWDLASGSPICARNYTIDDLYATATPTPAVGLLTRWFCGHSSECADAEPQPAAARAATLRRAMSVLSHDYMWVGVLERFEDSLRLLAAVLPTFFGGMAVQRLAREHVRPHSNASGYVYQSPTRETLHKLAFENENDVKLYRHALRVLDCRLAACGLPRYAMSDVGRDGSGAGSTAPARQAAFLPPMTATNAAAAHLLRRRRNLDP